MTDNRMRNAARRLAGVEPLPEEKPKPPASHSERLDAVEAGQRRIQRRRDARDYIERTGGVAGAARRVAGVEGDFNE
jgi:hypothetical protein